jgi:transcription initiation factor TFIIIB Brf1 subunit/transcription initiation factor TFIIB
MRPVLPESSSPTAARCPRCGSSAGLHYVHGHAQCGACGANIEDCCQGANCDFAARDERPPHSNSD